MTLTLKSNWTKEIKILKFKKKEEKIEKLEKTKKGENKPKAKKKRIFFKVIFQR